MSHESPRRQGRRALLTETRIGSVTPVSCLVQMVLTGLAAAAVMGLLMTFAR
jgi:hypothetical protein